MFSTKIPFKEYLFGADTFNKLADVDPLSETPEILGAIAGKYTDGNGIKQKIPADGGIKKRNKSVTWLILWGAVGVKFIKTTGTLKLIWSIPLGKESWAW